MLNICYQQWYVKYMFLNRNHTLQTTCYVCNQIQTFDNWKINKYLITINIITEQGKQNESASAVKTMHHDTQGKALKNRGNVNLSGYFTLFLISGSPVTL